MFVLWLLMGLVLIIEVTCRLLNWVERQEWAYSSAHELGHAAIAWFACRGLLRVRDIRHHLDGYRCHCDILKGDQALGAEARWLLLAFCLGGLAAETVLLERLGRPRGCRDDLRKALNLIERLRTAGWPGLAWARGATAGVPYQAPLWAKINPRPCLDQGQVTALAIGFRLACRVVSECRQEITRARTRSWASYRNSLILSHEDLRGCFGDSPAQTE